MDSDFAKLVRSNVPKECLFLHIGRIRCGRGMIELKEGSLLSVSALGRAISPDGGRTWTEPEPLRDVEGHQLASGMGICCD